MTSTATCTVHAVDTYGTSAPFASPFAFSARHALRSSRSDTAQSRHASNISDEARPPAMKGHTVPQDGSTLPKHSGDAGMEPGIDAQQLLSTSTQPWRKRLSNLSTSTSSRTSSPRPTSMYISPSNGSTTPIFGTKTPPTSNPPNKLVKRDRSVSLRDLPSDSSGSKIPTPTLRRPATSNQRSATMNERRAREIKSAHEAFLHAADPPTSNVHWRTFFTPKIFVTDPATPNRRRNSTSIPNPIKRVYPDRKYKPTLISAAEPVVRSQPEVDGQSDATSTVPFDSTPQTDAPTPEPAPETLRLTAYEFIERESELDQLRQAEPGSRQSFNISEWVPTESQLWKRPFSRISIDNHKKNNRRSPHASPNPSESYSGFGDNPEQSTVRHNHLASAETFPAFNILPMSQSFDQHDVYDYSATLEADTFAIPPLSAKSSPYLGNEMVASGHASSSNTNVLPEKDDIYDMDSAKAVKSSPGGRRGPAIDSIFQESPPPQVHGRHALLRDFLHRGSLQDAGPLMKPRHSTIPEEDGPSTPAGSVRQQSSGPSRISPLPKSMTPDLISSSPPEMPSLFQLRHKATFDDSDNDQESAWSFEVEDTSGEPSAAGRFAHLGLAGDLLAPHGTQNSSTATTPQRSERKPHDRETRCSIFDWSEQQPFERSPGTNSPPRPKTVHGKKDTEHRGSRSVGRRAPSGLHTRSQSVPVAQEADGTRIQVVTNKFGTWGVGSKGVTEDWNEDFDFGDVQAALPVLEPGEEKRLDSGVGMLVPLAIRKQQTNVLANIGLLRDWGLLIEEIKELRMKASALGLLGNDDGSTWQEVEAMIDLADQESDEHTLAPQYSPSSSPSFSYDAFEEPMNNLSLTHGSSSAYRRGSVERVHSSPPRMEQEIRVTPATPRRPRKDSEAIARAVIEALQQKRVASDPGPASDGRLEKVHFDTATLRRIIPYVQDLRDRAKAILREAEGLYASPPSHDSIGEKSTDSKTVTDPPESPSVHRKSRRSTNTIGRMNSDDGFQSPTEDLAPQPRMMAVVR